MFKLLGDKLTYVIGLQRAEFNRLVHEPPAQEAAYDPNAVTTGLGVKTSNTAHVSVEPEKLFFDAVIRRARLSLNDDTVVAKDVQKVMACRT